MPDAVDHAPRLRRVLDVDRLADATQAERAQRGQLALVGPVLGLDLRHLHAGASVASASASGSGSAGGAPSIVSAETAPASSLPTRPRTALTDRPRSSATSSGLRSCCRPVIVAFTRLIGFCEPSDFDRMSCRPASSSTARTPPPAMTPVPAEAGLSSTRPEP